MNEYRTQAEITIEGLRIQVAVLERVVEETIEFLKTMSEGFASSALSLEAGRDIARELEHGKQGEMFDVSGRDYMGDNTEQSPDAPKCDPEVSVET